MTAIDITSDTKADDVTLPQLKEYASEHHIDLGSASRKEDVYNVVLNVVRAVESATGAQSAAAGDPSVLANTAQEQAAAAQRAAEADPTVHVVNDETVPLPAALDFGVDDPDKSTAENYRQLHLSTGESYDSIARRMLDAGDPVTAAKVRGLASRGDDSPKGRRSAAGAQQQTTA